MKKSSTNHKKVLQAIKAAAKQYGVAPYDVSPAMFWNSEGYNKIQISEWEIRKMGGLTSIRDLAFPPPETRAQNTVLPRTTTPKYPKYKPSRLENFLVHDASMADLFKAARLPDDGVFRLVVQPDTHVPEHDERALGAFCSFLKDYKPHGLVNLGDFLEMGPVSHWPARDASPRRFVPEVEKGREILMQIDNAAGPQCFFKRFLIGNHEDWLDQLLVEKIPEIYDGIERLGFPMRIQDFLGLKDLGYRIIPINEILRVGSLHFIHGYYTSMHHAKKHLSVFGVNLCYGHLHDVQTHSEVSVKGVHEAFSIGCLRTLNAPFLKGKPSNWSHAFAFIEFKRDGSYTRYVPIIANGQFSLNGKTYSG